MPSEAVVLAIGSRRGGIIRSAEERLRRSGYLALRDITCDEQQGLLCLRGRVSSYYLKQVAQSVVADVEGVRGIINQIEVITTARRAASDKGGRA